MHGNVWEWCFDDWHSNYEGAPIDGSAWLNENNNLSPLQQKYVCLRGGSWGSDPAKCRSASRNDHLKTHEYSYIGFRVACGDSRIN